jgi:hypothetical protein
VHLATFCRNYQCEVSENMPGSTRVMIQWEILMFYVVGMKVWVESSVQKKKTLFKTHIFQKMLYLIHGNNCVVWKV